MELKIKKYNELSTDELYEILRLRSAIFVVEQNCAYQDMDHADQRSIHLWLEDNEGIVAYGRVVEKGVFLPEVAIGRIISRKSSYQRWLSEESFHVSGERDLPHKS